MPLIIRDMLSEQLSHFEPQPLRGSARMIELFLSLLLFKPGNGTSEIRGFQVIARGLRVTHLHISCGGFRVPGSQKMRVQTVDCGGEESLWRRRLLGIRVLRQGAQQIGTTYDTNNPAVLNDRNAFYSMLDE